ncbi:hypothetical protein SAMD00019534_062050 [Acytostelium subglobosum LB1]|uniref:hypothetical protein n=1 Tax=Acytostelium subglobosum LB1 TaxID=1410327 RepID=UPI000644AD38|nr:hypothetical protein SAMD00019534_062050 [Acytostelium subglobosum LB1]GAM23030.1 hypothetical protein SAMD00019534_062050 [Acytostelium subglobosum LB1]|eukprot:XP_012754257.1 hypothetical protein SAMD00019534_062050 [Acytostelium subglobosum LB1]
MSQQQKDLSYDSFQELVSHNLADVDVDKNMKIYSYLSTLHSLVKQSTVYQSEGDDEKAYVLLLRFCVLTLEKLPKHPEYSDPKFINSVNKLRNDAKIKVVQLEGMKEGLTKRYTKRTEARQLQEQNRLRKQQQMRDEKKRIEMENKAKADQEQALRKEQLERQRLEQQKKRLEDQDQEQREFIMARMDTERKIRKNRLEQQALQLRAEAELELRRQQEQEQMETEQRELLHQQQQQKQQELLLQQQQLQQQEQLLQKQQQDLLKQEQEQQLLKLQKEQQQQQQQQQEQDTEVSITMPTTLPSPPVASLDTEELLSYMAISEKQNTSAQQQFTHSNGSSYLVDPTFATPPPQPSLPSPPSISSVQQQTTTSTISTTKRTSPEVQVDENHKFGYLSMDQLQQQQSQHQPPPPSYHPQQPQQQQHQPQYNNQSYAIPNQPPPHLQRNQPPPTYLTRPPQYIQPGAALPVHQTQPVNHINGTPNNTQSFLAMAQQQKNQQVYQQQQQPQYAQHQQQQPQYMANHYPGGAQPVSQQQQQVAAAQQPPAQAAAPKPNIDSPEASKKYNKLRKVIIGADLFNDFMRSAEPNTSRKIETCGILSGTLSNDVFKVTTLIIPKQEGTTDTCNTIEEHELFEYQLENDLLTLGWIHTHPTQDCFLSAVDVHTHCSYQYLLQEAIAIVISPMAKPNFGIFRLTDPPGMQTVQKCKLKSFHPHPPVNGVPIYTRVDHVEIDWKKQYSCKVVDLRNKK